jgi:pimeloyl-ACP methyl ester carboxylesterase
MAMARAGKLIEVADESFVFFVHPNRHGDVALRDTVRAMAEETGVEAYLRQQQAIMGRPDSRPGLAAIRCPTLMLVGEQDKGTPPELAREIAAGIHGARLVIVPDSGHLSTIEQPQAVTKALVEWMRA